MTTALGYEPNGSSVDAREGQPVRHLRFNLGRDRWLEHRRNDITYEGLEPCLPLLGATPASEGIS